MKYLIVFIALISISCISNKATNEFIVRCDVRFEERFFSIYISETGRSFIVRGFGSRHSNSLSIESSDTSKVIKLDSVNLFFQRLDSLKMHPVIGSEILGAQRIEIYYFGKKIYDSYKWDYQFWHLIEPIMMQLPKGYNPFQTDDFNFQLNN